MYDYLVWIMLVHLLCQPKQGLTAHQYHAHAFWLCHQASQPIAGWLSFQSKSDAILIALPVRHMYIALIDDHRLVYINSNLKR